MPKKHAAQRRSSRLQKISATSKRSHFTGLFFVMVNLFFWGIAPAIIKHGLDYVPPQVFLYYRFVIVLAVSTPFLFFMRKRYSGLKTPKQLVTLLTIGLLSNPITLGIFFLGLHYTTSASAAVISGVSPLFIIIASAIFLREKITRNEVIGAVIATVGTFLIILETPEQAQAMNPLLGNALIFLYNIVWTGVVLWMKKLADKHEPFLFGYTGWLMGAIVMGAVSLYTYPAFVLRPLMITQLPDALWPIVYMAIFGSLIAFTAYQISQKYLPASEAGIFTYLEPLFAIPLSLFWLHEKLGTFFTVGSLVIFLGVCIAEFHASSRLKRILTHHSRK
ncbi:MAG TPA: DMT family transporter [Candidatus Saccharimonadia bacterium]|nr:DMT family transporter [Candidatus Saccharimonadia bacterium]